MELTKDRMLNKFSSEITLGNCSGIANPCERLRRLKLSSNAGDRRNRCIASGLICESYTINTKNSFYGTCTNFDTCTGA